MTARRPLVVLLGLIFIAAVVVGVVTIYQGGVDFYLGGVRFRSSSVFRPVLVGALSWLALGRLVPRLQTSGRAQVLLLCLGAYTLSFGGEVSGDVVPTAYTALALATGRGTSLDGYPELVEGGVPYFMAVTPSGLRSEFSVGPSLLAWPVFLPAPVSALPRPGLMGRLGACAAVLLGLASVWLVMTVCERLASPLSPILVGLAFGLGTSQWATSATALWQHGPGGLWLLGAVERLLDEKTGSRRRLLALGASIVLAVFTRPPLGVPVLLVVLWTVLRYRRQAILALFGGALVALPLVFYNYETYGSILGAYATRSAGLALHSLPEVADTLFWLMASPSRGVLWFEPVVVLFLGVGIARARSQKSALWVGLGGFLLTWIVYAHWWHWWAGLAFGPRYMTDALPWCVLVAASVATGPFMRGATLLFTLFGALVNFLGTSGAPVYWYDRPPVDAYPERVKSLGDSQLLFTALASFPTRTRRACAAEERNNSEGALALWLSDWREHPSRRFAAYRAAEHLLRLDRLPEAERHARAMVTLWPDSKYAEQLSGFLPPILSILTSDRWIHPIKARASRNLDLTAFILDGRMATRWTTLGPQRTGDWVELALAPGTRVRGVTVFSFPDFAEGPTGIELVGTTPSGESVGLGEEWILAVKKGWVTLRFPPVELQKLKILLTRDGGAPWSVSEARVLVAEP